jgi:CRISPR-associated endonuclease/helicase Cas3
MEAFRYAAKKDRHTGAFHLVPFHFADVAAIADAAFEANPALLLDIANTLEMPVRSARGMLLTLIAMHDTGKIGSFQAVFKRDDGTNGLGLPVRGYNEYDGRHAYLGHAILSEILNTQFGRKRPARHMSDPKPSGSGPFPAHIMASSAIKPSDVLKGMTILIAASTGHHGSQPPVGVTLSGGHAGHFTAADLNAASELLAFFAGHFAWEPPMPMPDVIARISYRLNGFITVCDWLGSSKAFEYHSSARSIPAPDALSRFTDKQAVMDSRIEHSSLPHTPGSAGQGFGGKILAAYYQGIALPTARKIIEEYRPTKFWPVQRRRAATIADILSTSAPPGQTLTPTPMQRACDEAFTQRVPEGPVLVFIEDTTGSGKTEAGDLISQRLIARGDADGVYFGLPTMATADSAFARKQPVSRLFMAGEPSVVLSHARRHLNRQFVTAPSREALSLGRKSATGSHGISQSRSPDEDLTPPTALPSEQRPEAEATSNPDSHEWFAASAKTALLSDIGVGTIDTALAGALRSRHSTMRLWGLWGKVLVIDEVHAYDGYMLKILEGLLYHQALAGDPVILMSATLPSRTRKILTAAYAAGAGWPEAQSSPQPDNSAPPDPATTSWLSIRSAWRDHRIPVQSGSRHALMPVRVTPVADIDTVIDRLAAWARSGACAVWYRNTVGDVMAAAALMGAKLKSMGLPPPIVFHSRFVYADRLDVEARLIDFFGKNSIAKDRCGRIVISTQAGEQSLDIDFDHMVTDPAPLESMLQRLGRRRRHIRSASGDRIAPTSPGVPAIDARPDADAILFTAPLTNPSSGWYTSQSYGAATYIYPDHALVWLACRFLTNPSSIPNRSSAPISALDAGTAATPAARDSFVPALDTGPALEALYPDPELEDGILRPLIPKPLWQSHMTASGMSLEKQYQGRLSTFSFRPGLFPDWNETAATVSDGDTIPTRLGFGTTIVVLLKDHRGINFLREGDDPLELSSVRVPRALSSLPADQSLIDGWTSTLPDRLKNRIAGKSTILLTRPDAASSGDGAVDPDAVLTGVAFQSTNSASQRLVSIRYTRQQGLLVSSQRSGDAPK